MKWVRVGALVAPGAYSIMERGLNKEGISAALHRYTGFNMGTGQWEPHMLAQGWGPYLAAVLVTMGIPKISGILRRL